MFFKRPAGIAWIVVFLGNPGTQYENTRHNAGFLACDAFASAHGIKVIKHRFDALTGECEINGEKVLVMKPQTYMNLSGQALAQAVKFYKLGIDRVIVVSDEISLPPGRIRIRASGSAGGHNGLKNIISCLGGNEFARIRIGVGSPPESWDMKDWVLAKLGGKDLEAIRDAAERAAKAVDSYITVGPERTMNIYN